jgi:CRP-like cAMP-binding protein/Zn-dependent protease
MRPAGVYAVLASRGVAAAAAPEASVYEVLTTRLDPTELRPKLASDVEIERFVLRWGNDYAMAFNPRTFQHFRLEPWEADLAVQMDGTRSVKDIVVDRLQGSGELDLAGVVDLVKLLHTAGLLEPGYLDVPDLLRRKLNPERGIWNGIRRFVRTLSIEWRGVNGIVEWLYRHVLHWFFAPPVVWLSALVAVAGFAAFLLAWSSHRFGVTGTSAAAESLILLVLNYFLTFMHELGHAVTLVHNGRKVRSAGFMIYFGSPAFFVDSSDGLMMGRWPRIWQSFAGPFAELVIAGVASFVVLGFPEGPAAGVLYKFALLNYLVIFLNLIPLLELDGYWILSDLIQVPDLRQRALQFVRHDLWHKLRNRRRLSVQEVGLGLYGTLGVLFGILALVTSVFFWRAVFGGLISSLWNGGLPTRVLMIVVGLFLAGPVLRGLADLLVSAGGKLHAAWAHVGFRLETSWRVEAARLLDRVPTFEDLPENVLSDLAGRVSLRTFPAGKPVVRQGERADAFYVVRKGSLQVVEEDRDTGDEHVLRVLGAGDSFGELALATGTARTATVRAETAAELFEVDRSTFERLLADAASLPEFEPTFQAIAELRAIPAFAALEPDQLMRLLEHGAWRNVSPGEEVVRQGEVGDAFYAIGAGRVDIVRDGEVVNSLGPGAHFGEVALLRDAPRNATVAARTPLRVFRLEREGFDALAAEAFATGRIRPNAEADRTWEH